MNRFVTFRLWTRLRQPPESSPIYRRALGQSGPSAPWYVGCVETIGFVLFVPLFLFMGPIYGLAWSVGIAGSLNAAQVNGAYDLMAITPAGAFGASWAFACAALYRNRTFVNVNAGNTWAGRGMIVLLVYAALFILPRTKAGVSVAEPLLALVALALLIVVDHVQSIVLAVLTGMIAATTSREGVAVQWSAAAAYVTIQLGSYGLVALLMGLVAAAFSLVRASTVTSLAVTLIGGLVFFAAAREWIIRRLWQHLLGLLGADDAALDRPGSARL